MYSANLGYVPREVGFLGYLLELRWSSLCKLSCYHPFWSILRFPFQSYAYSVVYMASHDPSKYRFSTPTYVAMFATLLTAYYMYVLGVHKPYQPNRFVSAGILPCHRRADSRCRRRASSNIAIPSLSFQAVPSRTLPLFRLLMGNYSPSPASSHDLEVFLAGTDF